MRWRLTPACVWVAQQCHFESWRLGMSNLYWIRTGLRQDRGCTLTIAFTAWPATASLTLKCLHGDAPRAVEPGALPNCSSAMGTRKNTKRLQQNTLGANFASPTLMQRRPHQLWNSRRQCKGDCLAPGRAPRAQSAPKRSFVVQKLLACLTVNILLEVFAWQRIRMAKEHGYPCVSRRQTDS